MEDDFGLVQLDEQARIAKLKSYGVLDTARELMYDRVVFVTAQVFRVPITAITLLDTDRQWFKSSVGLRRGETPREIAFCERTLVSDDVLIVEDAQVDPRFANHPLVLGPPFIRFYAGAPLITPEGFRVGALCIAASQVRTFSSLQAERLARFAQSVVTLLETHSPTPVY